MAFTVTPPSLALPQCLTTREASLALRTASVASPKMGLSTLGFDPARFQTEPPACYRASGQGDPDRTHTGRRRRAFDQVMTWSNHLLITLGAPAANSMRPGSAPPPAKPTFRREVARNRLQNVGFGCEGQGRRFRRLVTA